MTRINREQLERTRNILEASIVVLKETWHVSGSLEAKQSAEEIQKGLFPRLTADVLQVAQNAEEHAIVLEVLGRLSKEEAKREAEKFFNN